MSFGVSASEDGASFDYSSVFARADAALYEAKRSGRDQVCGGKPSTPTARMAFLDAPAAAASA